MVMLPTITAGRPARTYKTARDNKDLYRSAEVEKMLSPGASREKGKEEIVYGTCDSGSSKALFPSHSTGLEAGSRASSRFPVKARILPSCR
jgi:hypothetical protein